MENNPHHSDVDRDRSDAGDHVPDKLVLRDYGATPSARTITVILPLHNEKENIEAVCIELITELRTAGYLPDLLLVDDGSTDGSLGLLKYLAKSHREIRYISFARNFGKEAALVAGLENAGLDFVLLAYMDSDGQHDPKDLVRMLRLAESKGLDIVCGARQNRLYQGAVQRLLAKAFYAVFRAATGSRIDEGVGDFNVLRPEVVIALRELREEHPFIKGLIGWIGFEREIVPISVRQRSGGQAKFNMLKMFKLAAGALLSFSAWPLRIWSIAGLLSAIAATSYLAAVVYQAIKYEREVPGYATIVVLILGLGGFQLFSIGMLGEYLARIYDASKRRPRYIIRSSSYLHKTQLSKLEQDNSDGTMS